MGVALTPRRSIYDPYAASEFFDFQEFEGLVSRQTFVGKSTRSSTVPLMNNKWGLMGWLHPPSA